LGRADPSASRKTTIPCIWQMMQGLNYGFFPFIWGGKPFVEDQTLKLFSLDKKKSTRDGALSLLRVKG